MEDIKFVNSRGIELAGVYYPSESGKGVIICHGLLANKDRDRLVNLAGRLNDSGFCVLRFDFSGCGESEEDSLSVRKEVEDLNAAIDFMTRKGCGKIGLVGESLAGLVCLEAYGEKINEMVLWAPISYAKRPDYSKKGEWKEGHFIYNKTNEGSYKISKEYFDERESVDREKLASKIKSSVLIIHGNLDETVPLDLSKSFLDLLPGGSRLEVIEGAGHLLEEDIEKVIDLTANWFKEKM